MSDIKGLVNSLIEGKSVRQAIEEAYYSSMVDPVTGEVLPVEITSWDVDIDGDKRSISVPLANKVLKTTMKSSSPKTRSFYLPSVELASGNKVIIAVDLLNDRENQKYLNISDPRKIPPMLNALLVDLVKEFAENGVILVGKPMVELATDADGSRQFVFTFKSAKNAGGDSDVDSSHEIPEEYKKHYSGELGEFDYDIRDFKLDVVWFRYIGKETDGKKIKIPDGIKDCSWMFGGCRSLTTAPEIPNGVVDCSYMFDSCESLTTSPKIPSSVKFCYHMFDNCESLTKAPEIPNSVKNTHGMFWGCTSLEKAPVIPNSVKITDKMFYGCPEEVQKAGEWNIEHRGQSYYDQN